MKRYSLVFVFCFLAFSGCKQDRHSGHALNLSSAPDSLELFAEGIISTPLNERDIAISSQGDEIFYSLFSYDNSIRTLIHIQKKGKSWKDPEIAWFAGKFFDLEPSFAPDGSKLYFISNRPMSETDNTADHNIWFVAKNDTGWSNPQPLPEIINSGSDEFYPSVSANGNLYFTAHYPDALGGEDIYMSNFSNDHYLKPERLDTGVNSVNWEFNAYVSPDEKYLLFSSFGRKDDLGGGDLYISIKDDSGKWTAARNLGPGINSEKLDYCPFIDWPRNAFYFTSNRSGDVPDLITSIKEVEALAERSLNGMGNIYWVNISVLGLENP